MLLVNAVQIAIGWAWHTAYRARHHWTAKREGALIAAAAVALIGLGDTIRTISKGDGPAPSPAAAITALATPVVTEVTPLEIRPPEGVETVEASPSPPLEDVAGADPIGAKIMERLGDASATGSIDDPPVAIAPTPKKPKAKAPKKPARRPAAD